jgi:hypothetical protein
MHVIIIIIAMDTQSKCLSKANFNNMYVMNVFVDWDRPRGLGRTRVARERVQKISWSAFQEVAALLITVSELWKKYNVCKSLYFLNNTIVICHLIQCKCNPPLTTLQLWRVFYNNTAMMLRLFLQQYMLPVSYCISRSVVCVLQQYNFDFYLTETVK